MCFWCCCFFSLLVLSQREVRGVRTGPIWGGGWDLLLPSLNQVSSSFNPTTRLWIFALSRTCSSKIFVSQISIFIVKMCFREGDPYTGKTRTCWDNRADPWTRENQITLQEKHPTSSSQHSEFPLTLFLSYSDVWYVKLFCHMYTIQCHQNSGKMYCNDCLFNSNDV